MSFWNFERAQRIAERDRVDAFVATAPCNGPMPPDSGHPVPIIVLNPAMPFCLWKTPMSGV